MINALHVEVRGTGQDVVKKQNILKKPEDKIDIIGANPMTIGIIISEELSTGDQGAKKQQLHRCWD